ncbi:MAG: hypothetical protein ACI9UJ_001920 [bacterium]|jgi:hypothetical protein
MKSRIKKFLAYGIGEIFLIAIGILLALQINNRNDQRKGKRELDNILSVVQVDLKLNIQEAETVLEALKIKTSYLNIVFDPGITRDSLYNNPMCFAMNTGFGDLTIRDRGVNLLHNFKVHNTLSSDSLITEIGAFYAIFSRTNETLSDMINDDVVGTLNYYRDHFDWYDRFLEANIEPDMIDDILANTVTRNRLLHHRILIDGNYSKFLQSFVSNGELLILDLNARIDDN